MNVQRHQHGTPTARRSTRRSLLGGAAASPMLAIAGCSTRAGTPKAATQAGAQPVLGNPKPGGILQLASANNPPTLDGNATSSLYTHNLLGLSMSRLLGFQTGLTTRWPKPGRSCRS